jgi:hypothetical protein
MEEAESFHEMGWRVSREVRSRIVAIAQLFREIGVFQIFEYGLGAVVDFVYSPI